MAKFLRSIGVLKKKKKSKIYENDLYAEAPDPSNEYEQLHVYEQFDEQKNDYENEKCEGTTKTTEEQKRHYDNINVEPSRAIETEDDYIVPEVPLGVSKNYLLVAAIDLGTYASGYAFSFKNDFKENPLKISTHIWASTTSALSTLKTPTCILFNPDGVFDSFGYDAQNRYSELFTEEGNKPKDWYFFQNFKMSLYENQSLTIATEIEAENSKTMPALTVFSESIRYLKSDLLKRVNNMLVGLEEDDILWILTVPAIWNDTAKLFMREAAEMSGIKRNQLLLALEPEAGAIYCKYQPVEVQRFGEEGLVNSFQPSSSYMIVDIGGGTVDITIHEICSDGKLKEIFAANGGPWGGNFVNGEYLKLIIEIVGNDVFEKFRSQYSEDYVDIMREFELKKQNFKSEDANVKIRIPFSLSQMFTKLKGNMYSDLQTRIQSLEKYKDKIEIKRDRMVVDNEIIMNLFSTTVDAITEHIDLILQKNINIKTLLLIGGFSECSPLQNRIRSHFKTKTIIIPNEASLSVLKGAVIFGHDQGIVSSRILKCTYGIECSNNFIEGLHDPSKAYSNSVGVKKCADIFGIIAKMGDSVAYGCASRERYVLIDEENIETARIGIFISTIAKCPRYITDAGCRKIGHIAVPMSGNKKNKRRKIYFSLRFGETEVKVLYRQDGYVYGEKLLDLLQVNS